MSDEISKHDSINACYSLLNDIINNPTKHRSFNTSLLISQNALASCEMPTHGIMPMSLNRWKHYANEILHEGWRELDKLRKQALNTLIDNEKGGSSPSRGTLADLQVRLSTSEGDNQKYINEIVRFSEQYKNLLEFCHIQARQSGSFKSGFDKHLKRYSTNPISIVKSDK
jgi:hypothetical protein